MAGYNNNNVVHFCCNDCYTSEAARGRWRNESARPANPYLETRVDH